MAKKIGDLDENIIKNIRQESIGLLNDLDSIGKSINANLQKVSDLTGESTAGFKESFNAAKALGDALSKVDSNTLKSKKEQATFQDKVRKAQEEAIKLEAKAARLRQEAVNFSKDQAKQAYRVARGYEDGAEKLREQAKEAEKITNQFEKLNNQTRFFDNMAEFTQQVPGLSKVLGDFQRASDAAREAASEGGSALVAGGKELSKLTGKAIAAFAVGNLVGAVTDLDERTTSAARNLNMSRDQASKLAMSLNDAAVNGITGKEAQAAVEQFADTLGTTAAISAEDAVNFATMTKQLGLATNEAAKLETLSLAIGESSKSITENIIGEVKFSNYRNKSAVDYKKVLKDVGNANAAILLSIKGQGKSLGDAGAAARRFGLDLNKVDELADSLLNFEQSISSELEAELLTGRDLNLERARAFALNNDIEGLTAEIAKNVGNAEQFSKMNRLQQEAIAKSVGMTRESLASSLMEQEALTKLGAKDAKQRDEIIEAEMERIETLKREGKFEEASKARKQLVGKLGSDELIRQRENRSLAELQLEATQKMKESMDNMATKILPSIQGAMQKIVEHADTLSTIFTVIGGLMIFNQVASMAKNLKLMSSLGGGGGAGGGGISGMPGGGGMGSLKGLGKMAGRLAGAAAVAQTGKGLYDFFSEDKLRATGVGGFFENLGGTGMQILDTLTFGGTKAIGNATGISIPGMDTDDVASARSIYHASGRDPDNSRFPMSTDNKQLINDILNNPGAYPEGIVQQAKGVNITELAMGGMVTRPTNALVGEAGPEAVVPLNQFYAKLDQLIQATKSGKDLYIDSSKVTGALQLTNYKSDYGRS